MQLLQLTPSQRVDRARDRRAAGARRRRPRPQPSGPSSRTGSRRSIRATRSCRCRRCASASPSGSSRRSTRRVADDLQRGRHDGDHGAAREVQGQLREGARREARLHVVLRQGVRRRRASCSRASTPKSSAATSSTRSTTTSASRSRRRRASSCRCCATATSCRSPGVEKGILELAEQARTGKLGLADLQGGTFSITNGGIYGSMMSTPLLNYPQTGILGMHNIVKRAVVDR